MNEIGVKELKNATSRVIEDVQGGARVIVTKRGRPAAVILSIEAAEDFVLAHADEFARMRSQARRDYEACSPVALADL